MSNPTRYKVGDKVVITEGCLDTMRDSSRSCVTPNYPCNSYIAQAHKCLDIVGRVSHTFPPGYEVTVSFDGESLHMKDNWVEKAP